jgi:hypothetical protein
MRCLAIAAACAAACILPFTTSKPAAAEVVVNISKSSQRMAVLVDGTARYNWIVSTGKRGFGTPNGTYRPIRLERSWYSRKYNNAPMPHSIFFYKGYAVHGTTEVAQLGFIASHGCVRLHPANAAALFALVQNQGRAKTRIVVTDKPIAPPAPLNPNDLVAENSATQSEEVLAEKAVEPPSEPVEMVAEAPSEPARIAKVVTLRKAVKVHRAARRVFARAGGGPGFYW